LSLHLLIFDDHCLMVHTLISHSPFCPVYGLFLEKSLSQSDFAQYMPLLSLFRKGNPGKTAYSLKSTG